MKANDQFIYLGKKMIERGYAKVEDVRKDVEGYAIDLTVSGGNNIGLAVKFAVHFGLYAKTISALGTEKHMHLVDRAIRFEDYGCFMMTELSHGSNVQALKTTATFDPAT